MVLKDKEIKRMLYWALVVYSLDALIISITGFKIRLAVDLLLWSSGIIVMPMIFNTKNISKLRIAIYGCFLVTTGLLYYLIGTPADKVLYFLCGCLVSASAEREFWIRRNPHVLTEED